ncbi:MAG: outer membrane protein assembly factor BamA [Kofleriaceae bacterium]|nr:outer membrane protein assembly factor BamA [Kofleriaceae bacterium]
MRIVLMTLALFLGTLASQASLGSVAVASAQIGPDMRQAISEASEFLDTKIEQVQFRGNRKVEDAAIRVDLLTKVGTTLDLARVRDDVRTIWDMDFFADIRVEAQATPKGGVIVIFVLTEKPSLRKILITGNDEVSLETINKEIDLKRDGILNITKIKQNRDKIQEMYVVEGYYLASVDYEISVVSDSEVDVLYIIDEHSKVEIRRVSFIGNDKVSDAELRSVMLTSKGGALSFLSDGGTFREDMFERDLVIITAYYYDRGYINVKIGTPNIRLSRDKKYMYLSIPIDEGPVFKVGSIDFKGDMIGKRADYYSRLTLKPGAVFNRSYVSKDIVRLNDYYKDRGYAYVNVTPLTNVDLENRTVDLSFEIEQGKKVYFERINVRGNSKTRDKVIRRELKISEGELYNQTNLEISKRRVTALGYFESVDISTKRGSSDEFIIVNVEISERATGSFQIGAGFSSVENFIAQAQISQNNLFGRGQTLSLQAQLSSLRQLFLLRFVEPWFLDSRWSFAFDVFNQVRAFRSFARNAVGGNLTWGYPINFETRAFLTYKLEDVSVSTGNSGFATVGAIQEPVEADSVANLFRGGVTSSLRASITYDTRNNRLFPTAGWHANAFLEVAEEYPTFSQNIFVRYGGFARHYQPLFGPFVLKTNAEIGITTSRDPLGVPITERYLIGGINDVRGYSPRSLGPQLRVAQPGDVGQPLRNLPLGGNMQLIWNSEIEFPIFKALQVSGLVFFDAGNAYNLEDRYCSGTVGGGDVSIKFDPCFELKESLLNGIRTSVGFGFRWFSPIGPLRFEWGIPLDRQVGEQPLVFEFTIGNFF